MEERWWLDQGFEPVVLFGEGLQVECLLVFGELEWLALVSWPCGDFWEDVLGKDAEVSWRQWS